MAIAVDNAGVANAGTGTLSFVLGGGADRIVIVTTSEETNDITNVTFNGVNMTFLGGATQAEARVEIWYMLEAQLPVAGTYNIATTGGAANGGKGGRSWTGVAQTGTFGSVFTNTGTASPISVDVTGTNSTDVVVDAAATKDPGTVAEGAGQSLGYNILATDVQVCGSREPGNGGTVTMSWTDTASFGKAIAAVAMREGGPSAIPDFNFRLHPKPKLRNDALRRLGL